MRAVLFVLAFVLSGPALGMTIEETLSPTDGGLQITAPELAPRLALFGVREKAVRVIADSLWGRPLDTGVMGECGAGPLGFARYESGVSLYFQDGAFAGWMMAGESDAVAAPGALVLGMSRSALEEIFGPLAASETTLGTEFTIGAQLYGLLDGPGDSDTLAALWSGVSCVFR